LDAEHLGRSKGFGLTFAALLLGAVGFGLLSAVANLGEWSFGVVLLLFLGASLAGHVAWVNYALAKGQPWWYGLFLGVGLLLLPDREEAVRPRPGALRERKSAMRHGEDA